MSLSEYLERPEELSKDSSTKSEKCFTDSPPSKVMFDPKQVYYLTNPGVYYVRKGSYFQHHKRWPVVEKGILRWLESQDTPSSDIKPLLENFREEVELDQAVDMAGSLAGHRMGPMKHQEQTFLVTDEPKLIEPAEGDFPVLKSIVDQAFPDEEPRKVFLSWLRDGVESVRKGVHQAAPMMVLAGPANAGKSLLAFITKELLGGREANPMTAWSGSLPWNDNLVGAELLVIDDSVASIDIRSRRNIGANFKSSIYAGSVNVNKRNKSSMTLRPVWRVMICCNEEPENLSVIPPLDSDIRDKITLLRVSKVKLPLPSASADEKQSLRATLRDEFPAFLHHINQIKISEGLTDTRSGTRAWHDQDLLHALKAITPEQHFEDLLAEAIKQGAIDTGLSLSAFDIQQALTGDASPVRQEAKDILRGSASKCGTYLSRLWEGDSPWIAEKTTGSGRKVFYHLQNLKED